MVDTAMPKISVRGLRKSFGRNRVLDGVDIDCTTGESLVIIGGSGTGKSVLVKCILGLLQPEAGSIRIDGVETVGLRRDARRGRARTRGRRVAAGRTVRGYAKAGGACARDRGRARNHIF